MKHHLWHRCLACLAPALLLATTFESSGDSVDITELLTPTGQYTCAGYARAALVDVDQNGDLETFVVIKTLTGGAYTYDRSSPTWGRYSYFFSGHESHCGTSSDTGRLVIWFVDALAPGFVAGNPVTWTYKSVPRVELTVLGDLCTWVSNGYREVKAYTERSEGGVQVFRWSEPCTMGNGVVTNFSSLQGIKEIVISSQCCENSLHYFVMGSTVSGIVDAGLRAHDGTGIIRLAAEAPGAAGALTSPLRFQKGGMDFGIPLVATDSPEASRFRIRTPAGTKALQKLP